MTRKPNKPVFVTQPALPPMEEFSIYLNQIWESKILTNNGPFHQQFEKELADYLGVKYLSVFANGTLALITALQALRITGEVITTPFSFVATTHSLWWNNIKPVFVDIEPEYFNLDPKRIEAAITPQTTAIMPVHVYGNPCKVYEIQQIADTYGLKVIYDAAHAFGVTVNGNSILNHGDLSILSFHATKTFNTIEGGAIICHDEKTKRRIDFLKNFGFADEVTVVEPGINAKMNELQAAYGLVQLKHVDEYIAKRKAVVEQYRDGLKDIKGIRFLNDIEGIRHSYTYFPILINEEEYGESRDEVYERLKQNNIYGRRYFYPLISQFPTYRGLISAQTENLPVATKIAHQVICLPIYPDLDIDTVEMICNILINRKI
ncbi:MAG: DegT/DnrJ/EryC1/StrS family aminotransferase [Clostridiaceae bacterium]|nr:DegT/DnrJ/EryC1/StrS family aminotransferase [Clostridiaceae bacterium]